jgi:Cu2+-containing amine oxidase
MAAIESGAGDIGFMYKHRDYKPKFYLEKMQPKLVGDKWKTADNKEYIVVHQYNRVKV